MPKKFGISTKSSEARDRKEAIRQTERAKKEKEAEDALWEEDDKHVLRKQQRKDDKERKKQEQVDKKLQNKMAYEEEMGSIKGRSSSDSKVTRAEIVNFVEKSKATPSGNKKLDIVNEQPLQENLNHLIPEGVEARTIEEAICALSMNNSKVDVHPERRMKASYQAFEDLHLPRLKAENPNLRLSQLKQMLKKDWLKSPDNPINQNFAPYNSKG